ncbi:MAG: hypothetical protein NVSMB5_16950 [Candidatus Velthaea sp.]
MNRFLATLATVCVLSLPLGAQAAKSPAMGAMPACKTGDPVVWINTSTKVFHVQGDSYFGKTKAGKYACKSDAMAMGAHMSGSKKMTKDSMEATSSAMPTKMKHTKKKGAMTMPDATPTP